MSVVKLRDSPRSKFGAMSGCEASIPVSMIPTSTSRSPGCVRYEPRVSAPIIAMSHWAPANGSDCGSRGGRWNCPRSAEPGGVSGFGPALPIGRLSAAPTSAPSSAARSLKSAAAERTVATPTALVLLDDRPAGVGDGGMRLGVARVRLVDDDVLLRRLVVGRGGLDDAEGCGADGGRDEGLAQ